MKTSDNLKKIREKLELQQNEFAFLVGISPASVNSYEHGSRTPSIKTCKKIIKFARSKGMKINLEDIRPDFFDN